jgi:MFS family permease
VSSSLGTQARDRHIDVGTVARLPRFARFWGACAASYLADGLFLVGLPLLAAQTTRSPAAVSLVLMAGRLPWLLLALPTGLLVDRADRRRLMMAACAGRGAALGGLAGLAATGHAGMAAIVAFAFCVGVGEIVFDTAALTLLPELTERHQLSQSNGYLQASQLGLTELTGPALGGLLAVAAIALPLGTAALLLVGSLVLVASLGGKHRPPPRTCHEPLRRELVSGLRFLWQRPVLRVFAFTGGALNVALGGMFAALPLFALAPGPMGLSASGYGLLLTAVGFGGLVAAPATSRLEARLGTHRLLVVGIAGLAMGCLTPVVTSNGVLVAAALMAAGATLVLWNVVTVSLRQQVVPASLLGRVNAAYRFIVYGGLPLGAGLGGLIGTVAGLRSVFAVAGGLTLAIAIPTVLTANASAIAAIRADSERGVET